MTLADTIRQILLRLPLAGEQWELSMTTVFSHDGPRLAAIANLAVRAPEGPTLGIGIGYAGLARKCSV